MLEDESRNGETHSESPAQQVQTDYSSLANSDNDRDLTLLQEEPGSITPFRNRPPYPHRHDDFHASLSDRPVHPNEHSPGRPHGDPLLDDHPEPQRPLHPHDPPQEYLERPQGIKRPRRPQRPQPSGGSSWVSGLLSSLFSRRPSDTETNRPGSEPPAEPESGSESESGSGSGSGSKPAEETPSGGAGLLASLFGGLRPAGRPGSSLNRRRPPPARQTPPAPEAELPALPDDPILEAMFGPEGASDGVRFGPEGASDGAMFGPEGASDGSRSDAGPERARGAGDSEGQDNAASR